MPEEKTKDKEEKKAEENEEENNNGNNENNEEKSKNSENKKKEFEKNVIGAEITDEMEKSYIDYAMSVIVARALPAVEDGLKPVHRRILYAMHRMGLDKGHTVKSARIVGECFVKDTQVLTTRGLIPIQDIERGDFVYTHNGIQEVNELYEMPERELVKIALKNGIEIRATPSQKFKIVNDKLEYEWKEAKELKNSDFVVIKNDFPELKENFKLKLFNNKYIELNENIAYLLGQFLSDGWIEKANNRIGFCSSSEHIINRLKFILEKEFGYMPIIEIKNKEVSTNSGQLIQSLLYVIRINNRLLCNFLAETFNLINKEAYTKEVPNQILCSPKKVIYSFISGLIDGDGSIHNKRNVIYYGSISEELIDKLLLITQQLGFLGKKMVSKINNPRMVNARIVRHNHPLYSIEFRGEFARKMALNLNLSDLRKKERLERVLAARAGKSEFDIIPFAGKVIFSELSEKHLGGGWYKNNENKKFRLGIKYPAGSKIRYSKNLKDLHLRKSQIFDWNILEKLKLIDSRYYGFLKDMYENKISFIRLKKIKKINPEKTYDIQVKNDHEFIANGIISHNCLGKFHPHGDIAVYDALVRMAQDFSLRYPLVRGQGNFGSIDNDPPAASRYTEAKLSEIAMELLEDLDKDTVKFAPNFDNTLKEPEILPAKLPNLLINGSSGIAVGMATNIPPHNLTEVCDAIIKYIENPEISIEKLAEIIQGPDFPTGGLIFGDLVEIYKTGKGRITLRGKLTTEEKKGREIIVITEIPYMVNKADLIAGIAKLAQEKKLQEISDIRDESARGKIRVVIELRKGINSKFVINKLYKYTRLQDNFDANLLALVKGKPQVLDLKKFVVEYVRHRKNVVEKRTKFELKKAEDRLEIVKGLLIALKDIDSVIDLIKKAANVTEAKEKLIKKYSLSIKQAEAILEIKLSTLTHLEQDKLKKEEQELKSLIEELKKILSSEKEILNVVRKEVLEIRRKYGDERKTQVIQREIKELEEKDLVQKTDVVVTITDKGYAKRMDFKSYKEQKRGGKGVIGSDLSTGDFVKQLLTCSTHDYLLFFTSKGKVYWLKAYEIPAAERYSKGKALVNMLNLKDETVQSVISVEQFENYLIFATKKGIVKKLALQQLSKPRASGVRVINLPSDNSDALIDVKPIIKGQEVMLITAKGQAIRFNSDEVREMGRASYGVTGIKLGKGDEVVSLEILPLEKENKEKKTILTITEKGYGKRSEIKDYRVTGRACKGVINLKVTEKTGRVVTTTSVTSKDSIVVTTAKGIVIRTNIKQIRVMGRATQGVRIIKLQQGDKVTDLAKLHENEVGEEGEK